MSHNIINFVINNNSNKFIVFVILLQNYLIAGYQEDTHNVAKRMELESCIGRFDVHEDTIIRTEESRSIGAKFLDNADLGSREECLRLCCETDGCDVFVFEEKSQGTCFLFQCGPPENFRCKFTRHSNYSSAVLTPLRQIIQQQPPPPPPPPPQPTQQIQTQSANNVGLSQHELELASLRDGNSMHREQTTTTKIPILGVRLSDREKTTTTTRVLPETPTQCSRFQFTCHSGECIAVYNACDGIPQCEDSSDEGPECPVTSVITTKIPPLGIAPSNNRVNQEIDNSLVSQHDSLLTLPARDSHPSIQSSQNLPSVQLQRNYQETSHNREDPMTAPQWPTHNNNNNNNINNNNNNNGGQQQQLYDNGDSHIFNHKGGLQLSTNNIVNSQYSNSMHDNTYPSQVRDTPYMMTGQDPYRNMLNQQQWLPDHRVPSRMDWPQQQLLPPSDPLDQQRLQELATGQQQQQQKQLQSPQIQRTPEWAVRPLIPLQNVPENVQINEKTKVNNIMRKDNTDETDSDDESDYEDDEIKVTEAPKKKPKKHKNKSKNNESEKLKEKKEHKKIVESQEEKSDRPLHEQLKMIKSDLEIEFTDHDGAAERPSGAVLSLTLGIIVTAALAVLVGCRMRVVGRRVRRNGKSPYAHDADFLVNGMYL